MSDMSTTQPTLITSRFAYQTTALGGEQQVIVSIPGLKRSLRHAEENAARLARRVDRREDTIGRLSRGLVTTTAHALRVANAVAALVEGRLLADSSISSAAPSNMTSVADDPFDTIKFINALLVSVEDCIIAASIDPTTITHPDVQPVIPNEQVTVDDVALDAAMTIIQRLDKRTIASSLSPVLSALEL